jgi:hypothetical protein
MQSLYFFNGLRIDESKDFQTVYRKPILHSFKLYLSLRKRLFLQKKNEF